MGLQRSISLLCLLKINQVGTAWLPLLSTSRGLGFESLRQRRRIGSKTWLPRLAPSFQLNRLGATSTSNLLGLRYDKDLLTKHEQFNTNDSTLLADKCLGPGSHDGFGVTTEYSKIPEKGLPLPLQGIIDESLIARLELTPTNLTVPTALILLNPVKYPSMSKARKAIRKCRICWRLVENENGENNDHRSTQTLPKRAKVGDRVYPGMILGEQERVSHGSYSSLISNRPISRNALEVKVLYQDDCMAVVYKPAGMLVYAEQGGYQRNTLKHTLPYLLTPPNVTLLENYNDTPLSRPELCHRLDKPTAGLVVIAKTLQAARHLSRQFEHRLVNKTYTAILNGKLDMESTNDELTEVYTDSEGNDWNLAENIMDDKHASTYWRALRHQPSPMATNQTLTLVELKPRTGRYHQLRRQCAWMYGAPIVGDTTYGGQLPDAHRFGRGLLLCAHQIELQHPYYEITTDNLKNQNAEHGNHAWPPAIVKASIPLPDKFERLLEVHATKWRFRNSQPSKVDSN